MIMTLQKCRMISMKAYMHKWAFAILRCCLVKDREGTNERVEKCKGFIRRG